MPQNHNRLLFVALPLDHLAFASKALFAVGFGAWDASVVMGAKACELALDAKF